MSNLTLVEGACLDVWLHLTAYFLLEDLVVLSTVSTFGRRLARDYPWFHDVNPTLVSFMKEDAMKVSVYRRICMEAVKLHHIYAWPHVPFLLSLATTVNDLRTFCDEWVDTRFCCESEINIDAFSLEDALGSRSYRSCEWYASSMSVNQKVWHLPVSLYCRYVPGVLMKDYATAEWLGLLLRWKFLYGAPNVTVFVDNDVLDELAEGYVWRPAIVLDMRSGFHSTVMRLIASVQSLRYQENVFEPEHIIVPSSFDRLRVFHANNATVKGASGLQHTERIDAHNCSVVCPSPPLPPLIQSVLSYRIWMPAPSLHLLLYPFIHHVQVVGQWDEVRHLYLGACQLHGFDDPFVHMPWTNVVSLGLAYTDIQDLEPMKSLPFLRCLDVHSTVVQIVPRLESLRYVDLSWTRVIDVRELGHVTTLDLSNTRVQDISCLKDVATLILQNCLDVRDIHILGNVKKTKEHLKHSSMCEDQCNVCAHLIFNLSGGLLDHGRL
jgi:hypothetical protein